MRLKIVLALLVLSLIGFAQPVKDTVEVQVFTWMDKSPEGWEAPYKGKVQFPEGDLWGKIILVQKLKCDEATKADAFPCGEWDYIFNTVLYVPKGDTVEEFELGSFVTPYGRGLWLGGDKGWTWYYDVTDYAPLFKGEMDIKAGNNQELLDLKFLFIKGIPPRDVISAQNLYPHGIYKYEYLADDSLLTPQKIVLDSNANGYKLMARISGHGHAGPHNCCEWDNKTHTYKIGGWKQFRWNVWKDCGFNPIYPQGGTWQFDRAGWCPGTKVDNYEFELTKYVFPGDTVTIDYAIEMYCDNGEKDGEYRMAHHLITYGKPNFKYNAELLDIITPSNKNEYSRINPICSNPVILIRNSGSETLKHLLIRYGANNTDDFFTYEWCGNLGFMETEEVILPGHNIWNTVGTNGTFSVILQMPNGIDDEYKQNNSMSSEFENTEFLPSEFVVCLFTNNINRAKENHLSIVNDMGEVMFEQGNFADSTEYKFNVSLSQGCYRFLFTDKLEDGMQMHWWYRNENRALVGINGKLEIQTTDGEEIKEFKYDFGEKLIFNFRVKDN